jgi:hypothetical protein
LNDGVFSGVGNHPSHLAQGLKTTAQTRNFISIGAKVTPKATNRPKSMPNRRAHIYV